MELRARDSEAYVSHVNGDIHEDIQHFDSRDVDWDQTRVAVVHHEICSKCQRSEIVHAARAVRDIAQDDGVCACEALDDIRDHAGIEQKSLGKLQRNAATRSLTNAPNGLVDLKVVVPWQLQSNLSRKNPFLQEGDPSFKAYLLHGFGELWVLQDGLRDLVSHATLQRSFRRLSFGS